MDPDLSGEKWRFYDLERQVFLNDIKATLAFQSQFKKIGGLMKLVKSSLRLDRVGVRIKSCVSRTYAYRNTIQENENL